MGPMTTASQLCPLLSETIPRGMSGTGGGGRRTVDEACSTCTSRVFSRKKEKRVRPRVRRAAGAAAGDLLEEKLASEWTGGVEGRKGACPTKKERSERSDSSGERCWEGIFSQLPTLLWILRFNGLLFFLALKGRQKKEEREMYPYHTQ